MMSKQTGRGWYIHDFAWSCYNCCCSVCTAEKCPYSQTWGLYHHRCAECVQRNGQMRKCLECDFFVNKYTKPVRFKVVRRWHRKGELEKRLDAIMQAVGANLPEDSQNDEK